MEKRKAKASSDPPRLCLLSRWVRWRVFSARDHPLCTGEQKRPAAGLAYGKASHHLSLQGNQVRLTLPPELLRFAVLTHIKIWYRQPPGWWEECCLTALFVSKQSCEQAATQRASLGGGGSARCPSPWRADARRACVLASCAEVGEGADPVCLPRVLTLPSHGTESRG